MDGGLGTAVLGGLCCSEQGRRFRGLSWCFLNAGLAFEPSELDVLEPHLVSAQKDVGRVVCETQPPFTHVGEAHTEGLLGLQHPRAAAGASTASAVAKRPCCSLYITYRIQSFDFEVLANSIGMRKRRCMERRSS
jgi:hypothetical protein